MEATVARLPRLMTAREVSDETRVPIWKIYDLVRRGLMPHVRLGRCVWFIATEVRVWIEKERGTGPYEA